LLQKLLTIIDILPIVFQKLIFRN